MSSRDWESLIHRHLDGIATPQEVADLSARLESNSETRLLYLRMARIHAVLASDDFDQSSAQNSELRFRELLDRIETLDKRRRAYRLAVAATALIALVASFYLTRPNREPQIAMITSIDGVIRWTGDGGHISKQVEPGQQLTGGTLESLAVDSSVALEFIDGSTVCISGLSALTISDTGQKDLHLREGNLSARVVAQPEGRPFRLLTPAAELEVRGTQFDVASDSLRTKLTVNKGVVRAKRTTDGKSVDVKAAQSTVATIETWEPLVATPVSKPISVWKANLARDLGLGEWISAAGRLRLEISRALRAGEITREQVREVYADRLADLHEDDGYIKATPMQIGRHVIYVASADVSWQGPGTVVLVEGNQVRIVGRVKQPTKLKIGFSAIDRSLESGARYMKSFTHDMVEQQFDIMLPIDRFKPDDGSPIGSPLGCELVNVFCFSSSREAELEVSNIELLSPTEPQVTD